MLDAACPPKSSAQEPDSDPVSLSSTPVDADPRPPEQLEAPVTIPGPRLMCVIEGARDPNLLVRIVGELARRGRVPDTLISGPTSNRPDTQSVTLAVTLSSAREAAHLAQRFATWPCVSQVRRLSVIAALPEVSAPLP